MIECQKLGLTKSIGVCNFNRRQLQMLLDGSSVIPANLQVCLSDTCCYLLYLNTCTQSISLTCLLAFRFLSFCLANFVKFRKFSKMVLNFC